MTRAERRETLFRFEGVLINIERLETAPVVKSYAGTATHDHDLIRVNGRKSRFERHPGSLLLYRIRPHGIGVTQYLVVADETMADSIANQVFPETPPVVLRVTQDAHASSLTSGGYDMPYV